MVIFIVKLFLNRIWKSVVTTTTLLLLLLLLLLFLNLAIHIKHNNTLIYDVYK